MTNDMRDTVSIEYSLCVDIYSEQLEQRKDIVLLAISARPHKADAKVSSVALLSFEMILQRIGTEADIWSKLGDGSFAVKFLTTQTTLFRSSAFPPNFSIAERSLAISPFSRHVSLYSLQSPVTFAIAQTVYNTLR